MNAAAASVPVADLVVAPEACAIAAPRLRAAQASLRRNGPTQNVIIGPDNRVFRGAVTVLAAHALGWPALDCVRIS